MDRGLDFSAVKQMTIGGVVDYCIEWNSIHRSESGEETKKTKTRKATQADWDAFLG